MKISPTRTVLAFAVAVTLVRLVAAASVPLTEDEAYYRLWAQHLQWGYYDHPPMVAWWISVGVSLFGDTALGIRLVAVLATGLATWVVFDLTRVLGGSEQTGIRASVWYNATTTIGLGGMAATPDGPATLFWILTLWALAKVWAGGTPRWWWVAGMAAGLACISKYSALFLGPGVFLWLCVTPDGRERLKSVTPWTAVIIAAAIFSTNLWWNAHHDWITFAKQFGRIAPSAFSPKHLTELILAQFILLNPMIAILAARAGARSIREGGSLGGVHLALPLATALPFSAYLILHSLHDRVEAHWPVPLFAGLVICAAVATETLFEVRRSRLWRAIPIALGFTLTLGAMGYAAMGAAPFGSRDPILPLRNWPGFARSLDHVREQTGAGWIGTISYGTLAQLQYTKALGAPVVQIFERSRYLGMHQPRPDLNQPGLIVDLARRQSPDELRRCFKEVKPVGVLGRGYVSGPFANYGLYLVAGPKFDVLIQGCPEPAERLANRKFRTAGITGLPG